MIRDDSDAVALANLGGEWLALGRLKEAEDVLRRAVSLIPPFGGAFFNLGVVLEARGLWSEAESAYRRAIVLMPNFAPAFCNLGAVIERFGQDAEAESYYRRAVALDSNLVEARVGLGNVLKRSGRFDDAVEAYRHAVALRPDFAEAHANLGVVLRERGDLPGALDSLERALALGLPDGAGVLALVSQIRRHLCLWEGAEERAEAIRGIVRSGASSQVHPFGFLAEDSTPEEQLMCARRYVAHRLRPLVGQAPTRRGMKKRADGRLRLGYLSADFHQHATAWLIAELIELHNRHDFQVFGYSCGPDDDSAIRRRLASSFDRFVDLRGRSHVEAARRIANDGVDILVDLKGHTYDARLEILSLRPALVQVNWLGYPGTMGADFIDYILVDSVVAPPEHQSWFAERLVYLPECYQINDRRREIAFETPSRASCGLPEDGVVFCCFNNLYKITSKMFDLWMRLLKAVPGSVLWLLEGNVWAPERLRKEAMSRGVAGERLIFAPRLSLAQHLARHRLADVFLDTLPVNAHTTASDALWAGTPVVTCMGASMVGRVAASLLRAVGLPELATTTLEDYECLALLLARDEGRRKSLRRHLETTRETAALWDSPRFARSLEDIFRKFMNKN
ncbi:protein O-GlcNAc transferase [Azospirillaceae bacterium]